MEQWGGGGAFGRVGVAEQLHRDLAEVGDL